MAESPHTAAVPATGAGRAIAAVRWLGETLLFTALGLVWAAFGFWLIARPPVFGPGLSGAVEFLTVAWLALGGFLYGMVRPARAGLAKVIVLAACLTLIPMYYMAGLPGEWDTTFRWLTPAEFAAWLWRGHSAWSGEGLYQDQAPWQKGLIAVVFLTVPIAIGLLIGNLVRRSPRRPAGPAPPALAD